MQLAPTRRTFLAATLAGTASLGAPIQGRAEAERTPVVDTHTHCFAGRESKAFPYYEKAPYQPSEEASPETLLERMDGAGVDHAVIVHPEPYQDDHRYLEHCLKVGGKRLKGTCLFFADRPGSLAALKTLAGRCSLVAARIHAYAPDRLPPFGKPELRALWKQAGELGLAIQLHFEPRYAAGFEPLIKEFPDIRVIVDHLGRPFQGKPEEYEPILKWGKFRNVVLKVSAVPTPGQYPQRDIRPVLKQSTEAFGADRLIWGGDFKAGLSAKDYRAERDRVIGLLDHLSAADQAKVLGGTATRLMGFGS